MRCTLGLAGLCGFGALLLACSNFKDQSVTDGGASEAASDAPGDSSTGDSSTVADGSLGQDAGSGDAPGGDTGSSDGAPGCGDGGCPVEVLVNDLRQATIVMVDANNIYFADPGVTGGVVYQCPKTGCATPTTLGTGYATGLGIDGTNVYWNDFTAGSVVSCTIGGCGGAPKVLVGSQTSVGGVTCDGANLYWSTEGNVVTCAAPGCGSPSTLATGQGTVAAVAAETGIAYWTSTNAGGSVESCAAAGCNQKPAEVVPGFAETLVVKAGTAYFTIGNAVDSCPVTGCTSLHTIGSSSEPYGMGTDGVDIYWLDGEDDVVYRCPALGCSGGPTHFADNQPSASGATVALDADYVYWTATTQVLRKHR